MDRLGGQLSRLCGVVGIDPAAPVALLSGVLGEHGSRSLSAPPAWPSGVADDHTPIEFSLAYNETEPPALRILAEVLAPAPGVAENMAATYAFLHRHADRYGLSTRRLDMVRDLFAGDRTTGDFGLWISLVFRAGRRPEFKVYFNPEVTGAERAPEIVAEALRRLGLGDAYARMLDHAVRPGELGRRDRLTFFALDLHDGPQARVKLYLSHHDAGPEDAARAAAAVDGVDPAEVAAFCVDSGRAARFDGRPLVDSYTITEGVGRPVGYSIYVPIRDYVGDDRQAHHRMLPLLDRYGFDPAFLDRAIAAVTDRPLDDGVGLLAHVSLRLGPPRPGMTVYLSSEAYQVMPPRPLSIAV
ncbi:tryptophan dimethylallyltransferase family protein [Actinoplanes sp. NEAU-A12]|uniref:Tryptophan dimethylallyltransferase family protein n=1 Tax=Actinoplanes sandaracinus TaxID=3045177 RepID=A0ABT6WWR0_9ACTN|nr:tryptophan dimethylallyltransferase family protein [Actinoplanes sandaracinus]MDI6104184.1 tryptophan dimethylallyltransferase family protein [Actinoplanes sandaracinus]